jgi:hypothetical protein
MRSRSSLLRVFGKLRRSCAIVVTIAHDWGVGEGALFSPSEVFFGNLVV